MDKKVVITGTSGFIGSALAKYYLKENDFVYGINRRESKNIYDSRFKSYVINLEKRDVTEILSECNPDIIIHCAGSANVSESLINPIKDFEGNVKTLYTIIQSVIKSRVKSRFVFLSSAAVYGNPEKLPISENHPINPISPYGLHKKICEDICSYYRIQENLDIRIARIFSAFGDGLRKQLFWDSYNKIKKNGNLNLFGSGMESRDFIYIDDLVQAIYLISNHEDNKEYIFNIANGEEITIKTAAENFVDALELPRNLISFNNKLNIGNPNKWVADITNLKKIGYTQQVEFLQGVKNYVKWVVSNGEI